MKSFLVVLELNPALKTFFWAEALCWKEVFANGRRCCWNCEIRFRVEMKSGAILDMVNLCYALCTALQALSFSFSCIQFSCGSSFLNLSNANLSSFSTFKRLAFISTSLFILAVNWLNAQVWDLTVPLLLCGLKALFLT